MMRKIEDIAVKACISVQPGLSHAYRSCQPDDLENCMAFQILGLDIMIDTKLKPWLIEVN
jgi:tubulin polyglutamylase TTLL6/13